MSLTRIFVSRAVVECDRNWESFARRQGCVETWTLAGVVEAIMVQGGRMSRIEDVIDKCDRSKEKGRT